MNTTKKALLCTAVILTACFLGISLFPKDNSGADQGLLRIGAGDDISGYLMDETLSHCGSTVQGEKAVESFEIQRLLKQYRTMGFTLRGN